jgi:hypothetical protein
MGFIGSGSRTVSMSAKFSGISADKTAIAKKRGTRKKNTAGAFGKCKNKPTAL